MPGTNTFNFSWLTQSSVLPGFGTCERLMNMNARREETLKYCFRRTFGLGVVSFSLLFLAKSIHLWGFADFASRWTKEEEAPSFIVPSQGGTFKRFRSECSLDVWYFQSLTFKYSPSECSFGLWYFQSSNFRYLPSKCSLGSQYFQSLNFK